jgi:hypothetical protein
MPALKFYEMLIPQKAYKLLMILCVQALELFVRDSASDICDMVMLLVSQGSTTSFFSASKLLDIAGTCMVSKLRL